MKHFLLTLSLLPLLMSLSFSQKSTNPNDKVLMNKYDVKYYGLNLSASNQSVYLEGYTDVLVTSTEEIDTFAIELHESLTIDSIFIQENNKLFSHIGNMIYIDLTDNPIAGDETFLVKVYYNGESEGNGISRGFSWSSFSYVVWTLSESYHSADWFPSKMSLTDKADSADINITVPQGLMVGSNGLLETDTIGDNIKFMWKTRYPVDYYLLCIAIGEYREHISYSTPEELNGDSILIQHFIYDTDNYYEDNVVNLDSTGAIIELYSELFGLYPFYEEKYGHVSAPIGGGMEHQTMSTMYNYSMGLIIHELAHQWFGDYVTCGTWQDIWFNEGFASYSEYLSEQYLASQTSADDWMIEAHDLALEELEGSVYIPFEDVYNEGRIFSYALSYKKGAALVHMLRYLVDDDELFFGMLKNFLEENAFGTATGDELKAYFNANSGYNFDNFFNQWYYGKGFPTYDVWYNQDADNLSLFLNQTTSSAETALFNIPVEFKVNFDDGTDTLLIIPFYTNYIDTTFDITKTVSGIEVDPDNWILNGEGSVATDINNIQTYDLKLYPNPAQNILNVSTNTTISNFTILDISGNVLKVLNPQTGTFKIDIDDLPSGVYIIRFNQGDDIVTKRFVKM